jgi:hypothetical protein
MASERTLLFKENVRDPETMETFYRGVHPVEDDAQAERLLSYHAGLVEDPEVLASENKSELVRAAEEAGVPVEDSDKKEDVAKKLGAKKR